MDPKNPDGDSLNGPLLAATLRSVGDAVLIADREARVTLLSPVAEMLTGWTTGEAEGRFAWEILRLRDDPSGEARACPVRGIVEGSRDERHVEGVRVLDRDGASRPVSYDASAVYRAFRELAGVVVVFHVEPPESEAETDRLGVIARAVNDAAWDLDVDTGRLRLSAGACSVFGLEPERIGTTLDWWIGQVHPTDRKRVTEVYVRASEEGRCFQQEYRLLARGDCCAVLERGYVVRDSDGGPVRMFAALIDFTERRAA